MSVRRLCVIAYHSSPLIEPGSGDAGGMTVYVRELAEALSQRGLQTDIFTRAAEERPGATEISPGVRVICIPAGPPALVDKEELSGYLSEFVAGIAAYSTGTRIAYDLVHSHYWQSGLAASALASRWRVPLVHSHHTLGRVKNGHLAPGDVPESQTRLDGEAQVIAAADVLVASTDQEWEQLACLYGAPHDRLKTLHPGVDHELFHPGDRPAARRELGFSDTAVMLYVGRVQPLKGIELAVRAAEQLVPALDKPLAFLIVGGASGRGGERELDRLHDLVEEFGLQDTVRFVGPQPHSRLPLFYRAADALVVCSHSESFGLAALEAHACGTPVVGTPVGGLGHIVHDGLSGFLVDSRDPAVFAQRLKTVLADRNLAASFGSAAVHSARSFSWDRTADEFLELYECLVREPWPEACTC